MWPGASVKTDQSIPQTKSEKIQVRSKDVNAYYSENKGKKYIKILIQVCSACFPEKKKSLVTIPSFQAISL